MPHELLAFRIVLCFIVTSIAGILFMSILFRMEILKNKKLEHAIKKQVSEKNQESISTEKLYFAGMIKVIDNTKEIRTELTDIGRNLILSFKTVETTAAFLYGFINSYENEGTINIAGKGLHFDALQSLAFQQAILMISQHLNGLISNKKGEKYVVRPGNGSALDMESPSTQRN